MDESLCLSALLVKMAWFVRLQLQRDQQIETQRRLRFKKLKEEQRLRRMKLLAARRRRAEQRRTHRRRRLLNHNTVMKAMAHRFFTECVRTPGVWALPRNSHWWESVAKKYSDEEWILEFRVSKKTFYYLCRKLKPELERQDTTCRLCIPLSKRVAVALYKLANQCEYKTVGNLFAVSITSVCRCLHEFCSAVITVLQPELVPKPDQAMLSDMSDYFEQYYSIPQCVGVLGSCHVPVLRPSRFHSNFQNSKGFHSIILQAVVDGKGRFWHMNVGCPGKMHDATVLRSSSLWSWGNDDTFFTSGKRNLCGTDVNYFILGDSVYPSQTWLLTPYPDSGCLTPQEELYNMQMSQARNVAEETFGRLRGRWRSLCKRNDCRVEVIKDMVQACCVLHNLCERNQDLFCPEWDTGKQQQNQSLSCPLSEESDADATDMRLSLQQYFVNNVDIKPCLPSTSG